KNQSLGGLFAEAEADETGDGHGVAQFLALLLEELGDGDLVILHEALFQEAAFGEELADLALEDVLDDVGRLAALGEAGAVDLHLGIDDVLRNVLAGQAFWSGGGDVEGKVLDEFLEGILGSGVFLGGA